jgi:predicted membrane-bound spermidine synthase
LFTTGFTSLAMEVAWTRAFTFVLKTTIYAFAMILTTYLLATWIGSYLYRRGLKDGWLISTEGVLGAGAVGGVWGPAGYWGHCADSSAVVATMIPIEPAAALRHMCMPSLHPGQS